MNGMIYQSLMAHTIKKCQLRLMSLLIMKAALEADSQMAIHPFTEICFAAGANTTLRQTSTAIGPVDWPPSDTMKLKSCFRGSVIVEIMLDTYH